MTALLSVGGNVYSRTDAPADELFFGSVDGVLLLRRKDGEWREEHRALQGLHVSSLLEEPRSGLLFAGTHNGGIYASADHGQTWERRGGIDHDEVYCLAASQAGAETRIYAGTEPAHLYLSTDLGRTWTDLPALTQVPGTAEWTFPAPPHVAHVKHIAPDPQTPDVLYVCVEQGALLKTTDAGKSWRIIFDGSATDAHRLNVTLSRPDWLYLSRGDWSIGEEGIYFSTNDGGSWARLNDRSLGIGYPDATVIHPDRPDLILFAGATVSPGQWGKVGDPGTHVARSRDAGKSWQILPGLPPKGSLGNVEALAMNVWPDGGRLRWHDRWGDFLHRG